MPTTAEFRAFYEAELKPRLMELDGRRKRVARGLALAVFVALACVVALFAIGSTFEGGNSFPWLGVVGAFALFYAVYFAAVSAAKKRRAFIDEFKRIVVGRIVRFVEPGLVYSPDRMIPQGVYAKSQLFLKAWDSYEGDDHVEGVIGKTPLWFSEVRTRYKVVVQDHKNGRREKWKPIFWGLFFRCEFNKTFRGRTFVFPSKSDTLFRRLGKILQGFGNAHGQAMRMDDPEFAKRFAVYGDDPVEARYVLSTSLMARLVRFHDKARLAVCLSFVASDLYVAIEYGKPLFEPRMFRTLVNYQVCLEYFDDLALVVGIVEELNLNVRIWGERAMT